jgi:hypothetical protein
MYKGRAATKAKKLNSELAKPANRENRVNE